MTSESAFVWSWSPGATEPVVAGRVDAAGDELRFTYARSYLGRSDVIPLEPGLPLRRGQQRPPIGLEAHGVIRDAAPDSWGMRVISRRHLHSTDDVTALSLITYLLESGSDRVGALDFQGSPDTYVARESHATLDDLVQAGERFSAGLPVAEALDEALTYSSAVGGARPKVLISQGDQQFIAKFSVSTDTFPWMQAEAIGMELATRCGVDAAATTLVRVLDHDVLLVERFDRPGNGTRRSVLSALTILGLHELAARHGSYVELAERIRLGFSAPHSTLHEMFRRLVVSVLVGNTDDHPRNHAAFWDGRLLTLTPAFDVCPQPRSTGEAAQIMAFGPGGERRSLLASCVEAASVFQLDRREAQNVVDQGTAVVSEQFEEVCVAVGATAQVHDALWGRAVANKSIFYALSSFGVPPVVAERAQQFTIEELSTGIPTGRPPGRPQAISSRASSAKSCGAWLPRARAHCALPVGHAGHHRSQRG